MRYFFLLFWLVVPVVLPQVAPAQECRSITIGLDTTRADQVGASTTFGEAVGQTFFAPATALHSISVWRVAEQDSYPSGLRLYVCNVDSTGMPLTQSLLFPARMLTLPFGDGIHPQEFRYVFDPPAVLPAVGRYCFFIQAYPCLYWSDLLVDAHDGYIDGSFWRTGRSIEGCDVLREFPSNSSSLDLIFTVEFCDQTTPVRRSSWGAIKRLYR